MPITKTISKRPSWIDKTGAAQRFLDKLQGGRPQYESLAEKVETIHREATSAPSYGKAIDLCVADRDLWMCFYSEWLENPSVGEFGKGYKELLEKSIKVLGRINDTAGLSDQEQNHVSQMVKNTGVRARMFGALYRGGARTTVRREVRAFYYDLIDEKGLPLSTIAAFRD